MAALRLPGWMQPLMRHRKTAATADCAAFGTELGLDLSLAPRSEAPPRTLPRSAEELQAQRLRRARREDDTR